MSGKRNTVLEKEAPKACPAVTEVTGHECPAPGQCGWGPCAPACMQPLASMWAFIACYFAFAFVHGIQGSITISMLTTLERRFNLPSSLSGMLATMSSIGYAVSVMFVAHFGRNSHIPRIFSVGIFFTSICGVLYSVPHYIYGTGNEDIDIRSSGLLNDSQATQQEIPTQHCSIGNTSDVTSSCHGDSGSPEVSDIHMNVVAYVIFSAAEIIHGICGSPIWSVGISYLDTNTNPQLSAKLIGLMYSLMFFSPVIGFAVGAALSNVYASLEDTVLEPGHPRWVGAWWLAYISCACLVFTVLIPTSMLPKHLRPIMSQNDQVRDQDDTKLEENGVNEVAVTAENDVKAMFSSLGRLVCNPAYITTLVALTADVLFAGFIIFTPKYLEVHYQMSTWWANITGGMGTAIGGGLASYVSGLLVSWTLSRKSRGSKAPLSRYAEVALNAALVIIFSVGSLVTLVIMMLLDCPQIPLAGNNTGNGYSVDTLCNWNCSCSVDLYDPVCGEDNLVYFSPCHAGCVSTETSNTSSLMCGCVYTSEGLPGGSVTSGLCDLSCTTLIPYVVIMYICIFIYNMYNVPVTNVLLRSVEPQDKSLAMGLMMCLLCICVFPAPLLYGLVIDSTCLLNKASSCSSELGVCLLYNRSDLRLKMHGLAVAIKCLTTVLYLVPWIIARSRSQKGNSRTQEMSNGEERQVKEKLIVYCKESVM